MDKEVVSSCSLFSVRDNKVGSFLPPFCARNDIEALREFGSAAQNEKTKIHAYPEDFDLYRVAFFSENSGRVVAEQDPVYISGAKQVIQALRAYAQDARKAQGTAADAAEKKGI